jgi:hypothetical protein
VKLTRDIVILGLARGSADAAVKIEVESNGVSARNAWVKPGDNVVK